MGGLSRHNRREREVANAASAPETNTEKEVDVWIERLNQKVRDLLFRKDDPIGRRMVESTVENDIEVDVNNGRRGGLLIRFTVNGLSRDVYVVIWALLSSEGDKITTFTTNGEIGVDRIARFDQKDLLPDQDYRLSFHKEKPADAREG